MKTTLLLWASLLAVVTPHAEAASPTITPASGVFVSFDEAGRTFPKVAGQEVIFSGACNLENGQVQLTGSVNARAVVRKGRWETAASALEPLVHGTVEVTATVLNPAGATVATAKLKFSVLNLLQEGAIGDGTTDDLAAIRAALKKAKTLENAILYAPAGHVYAHSDTFDLNGQELLGGGDKTVFLATDPMKSAVFLKGDASRLRNVLLDSRLGDTKRQSTPPTTMVAPTYTTNFWVDHVTLKAGASAGIFSFRGSGTAEAPARITNCNVAGTLADGIHMTNGSHHILVEGNTGRQTGDDLIAVVSYGDSEEAFCHDIVITHNNVGENNWARGITVVGGERVLVAENTVASTQGAGIYVCSEGSFKTNKVNDVLVRGNRISHCPADMPSLGGIFVQGWEGHLVSNVRIEANVIEDSPQSAIIIGGNTHGTTIRENQIKGTPKTGILVRGSATDMSIAKNHLERIGGSGITVDKDVQGFCRITDNDFATINSSGQPHGTVIKIEPGAGLSPIEVVGNKNHPGRYRVEKVVDCKSPRAIIKSNY